MSDKTELQNIIGIQADRIFDLEERIEALEAALREKDLLKHLSENPIERMALDRIEALEAALGRIERGATSVLLDATLKDNPVYPDVLQEIINDVHAVLAPEQDK